MDTSEFSALLQSGLGCGLCFIKTLLHLKLFQNVLLDSFRDIFQKESAVKSAYSRYNKLHPRHFPENFQTFYNQLFFVISLFVLKYYMKDFMKVKITKIA